MQHKKVTENEFFGIIRDKKLDVVVSIVDPYPYLCIFKFRNGREFGRIERDDKTHLIRIDGDEA